MASKRRNMFYDNKKHEIFSIITRLNQKIRIYCLDHPWPNLTEGPQSHPLVTLSDGEYRKKGHYSTRRSRGQPLLSRCGGGVEEDREDTRVSFKFGVKGFDKWRTYKELQIGHRPSNGVKDVSWEPYFCVLLQDEQTLTAYRSEELSLVERNHTLVTLPDGEYRKNKSA
ncbi:hypothetical protein AAG570_009059 [Ranatra chinensis]|uniref:Uncharacterized protein n=1 Tax=Ranatra chinensis TaxID=642074 RepID=A0ABD0ZDW0_9HEMI